MDVTSCPDHELIRSRTRVRHSTPNYEEIPKVESEVKCPTTNSIPQGDLSYKVKRGHQHGVTKSNTNQVSKFVL